MTEESKDEAIAEAINFLLQITAWLNERVFEKGVNVMFFMQIFETDLGHLSRSFEEATTPLIEVQS